MRSKFLRLNRIDFIRGLIVVIICSFLTGLYQIIANGGIITWMTIKPIVIAAVGAGISYLTKNLLTNSKGHFMKRESRDSPEEYGAEIY